MSDAKEIQNDQQPAPAVELDAPQDDLDVFQWKGPPQQERDAPADPPKPSVKFRCLKRAFVTHDGLKDHGRQVLGDVSIGKPEESPSSPLPLRFCFQLHESGPDSYIKVSTEIKVEDHHGILAPPFINPSVTTYGDSVRMLDITKWQTALDITLYEAANIPEDEAIKENPLYTKLKEDPKLACLEINYQHFPVSSGIRHQMKISPEDDKRLGEFDSFSSAYNVKIYFLRPASMDQEKVKLMRKSMGREHLPNGRFLSRYCENGNVLDLAQLKFLGDSKLGNKEAIRPKTYSRGSKSRPTSFGPKNDSLEVATAPYSAQQDTAPSARPRSIKYIDIVCRQKGAKFLWDEDDGGSDCEEDAVEPKHKDVAEPERDRVVDEPAHEEVAAETEQEEIVIPVAAFSGGEDWW